MGLFDALTPQALGPVATAAVLERCKADFDWEARAPITIRGPVLFSGMFTVEVATATQKFYLATPDTRADAGSSVPELSVLFPLLKETV